MNRNASNSMTLTRVWRLRAALGALLLPLLGASAGQTALAQPSTPTATVWKLATAYSDSTFHTQNIRRFADDIATSSEGALRIEVHANGSLFKAAEVVPAVRAGKVEAGEVILSSLAAQDPLFGIDAVPFLVSGYDDAQALWTLSRPYLEKRAAAQGMVLLYAVPWPPQHLYSSRAIGGIKDFKALQMRTYNPATQRLAELTGAKPTLIQVADLGAALADGRVDLMFTSSWTGVETRAWSRMTHFYTVHGWIPKNAVFVQRATFEKLPPALRERVIVAARTAELRGWSESQANAQRYERELVAAGITVALPNPFLQDELRRLGERFAREWLKTSGSDGLNIVVAFEAKRFAQR